MICVSIGRSRHRHMIAEHRALADKGAPLVELRLDYIKGDVQLRHLLSGRPCPVVATCRREQDGGKYSGSEESRQAILRMSIAEGVEYVDLEEDVAASIPRFGATRRIISMHDFRKTPDDLEAIHRRLSELDPDIVKLATLANSPADNLRMLKLIQAAEVPTIGICMGEMGTTTRILATRFGAPFTYATFHQERPLAPGQLSYDEMMGTYHFDKINAKTAVYAVIADPVGHSLSPLIHNSALRDAGLNAVYVPIRVPREHLDQFLQDAPQMGVRGMSVTIPHKEAVVRRLDKIDRVVMDIQAANTLVYTSKGLVGFNTDSRAAVDSLEAEVAGGMSSYVEGKTALVLGAGGAAKAIAYGLLRRGARVFVSNRTHKRAKDLAGQLNCQEVAWSARHNVGCSIVINCTPLGMHPNVDESPFEKHHLKPAMVVFDSVYNPENTLLIKSARSQGCRVVLGSEMFVRQAALQFNLFTGCDAPFDLMRTTLRRAIGAAQY